MRSTIRYRCRTSYGFLAIGNHGSQPAGLRRFPGIPVLDQTTSPAGTWFQIYINQALAWWGQTTSARLDARTTGPIRVDIGTVLAGEEQTSFASSLPSAPARRAELSWLGGTFESTDIAGFQVWYSAAAAGELWRRRIRFDELTAGRQWAVRRRHADEARGRDHRLPVGHLHRWLRLRRVRLGRLRSAAGTYTWTSDPLSNGVYWYAVVPYDSAGNLGTPATTSVTIEVPPLEPPLFEDDTRLHYTYDAITDEVTLYWNETSG